MSESKHTRGPWHQGTELTQIEGLDGTIVCHVSGAPSNESVIADARLIAAAPELLEELQYLVEIAESAMRAANRDGGEYDIGEMLERPRAAIAKATGEQK